MRYFYNVRPTVPQYVPLFSSPNDQRRFLEQQLDVTSEPFRLVYDMSIRCGFVRTFSNKKYNDGTGRTCTIFLTRPFSTWTTGLYHENIYVFLLENSRQCITAPKRDGNSCSVCFIFQCQSVKKLFNVNRLIFRFRQQDQHFMLERGNTHVLPLLHGCSLVTTLMKLGTFFSTMANQKQEGCIAEIQNSFVCRMY